MEYLYNKKNIMETIECPDLVKEHRLRYSDEDVERGYRVSVEMSPVLFCEACKSWEERLKNNNESSNTPHQHFESRSDSTDNGCPHSKQLNELFEDGFPDTHPSLERETANTDSSEESTEIKTVTESDEDLYTPHRCCVCCLSFLSLFL